MGVLLNVEEWESRPDPAFEIDMRDFAGLMDDSWSVLLASFRDRCWRTLIMASFSMIWAWRVLILGWNETIGVRWFEFHCQDKLAPFEGYKSITYHPAASTLVKITTHCQLFAFHFPLVHGVVVKASMSHNVLGYSPLLLSLRHETMLYLSVSRILNYTSHNAMWPTLHFQVFKLHSPQCTYYKAHITDNIRKQFKCFNKCRHAIHVSNLLTWAT